MTTSVGIATRGRVSIGQAVAFAAIGWVLVAVTPTPSQGANYTPPQDNSVGEVRSSLKLTQRRKNFVLKDDDEILNVIKMFLECQK